MKIRTLATFGSALLVVYGCGGGGGGTPAAAPATGGTTTPAATIPSPTTPNTSTPTNPVTPTPTTPTPATPSNAITGLPNNFSSVFAGNVGSQFVALSSRWAKATSATGNAWAVETPATTPPTFDYNGGIYDGAQYYAFTRTDGLLQSTTGLSWTPVTTILTWPTGIAQNATTQVIAGQREPAVASGNTLAYRPVGGATWTAITTAEGGYRWNGLAFGNGIFVIVGDAGRTATSANGTSWTSSAVVSGAEFQSIAFASFANKFVAVGNAGGIYTSDNGSTWVKNPFTGIQANLLTIACGTTTCVTSGSINGGVGSVVSSIKPDGTPITDLLSSWRETGFSSNPQRNKSIVQVGTNWGVVGEFGSLVTSADGFNWTAIAPR